MTGAGGVSNSVLDRWLRPGANSARDVTVDLLWLIGLALLLMATGLGLRDPWPADEPRFALVAQDMLRSGDWMIPRVGGDLYADKPPVFFWLMAAAMALTGSLRIGFLLPSLLAGIGCVVLVYDLLRRVRGREVAFAGGLVLLLTFQFVWQFRQAQIDGVLCFFTTLSLYGLLRHLFAGPSLGWFYVGWFAAGIGVITKGVGFLPLLLLIPFVVLAARGWPTTVPHRDPRWWLGPVFFLGAIALWFVPMMLVTSAGGELLAYRNEILFKQTVTRYAEAWHHHEPFWFYPVNVIPVLWLPLTALVPWLWSRWRAALRPGSRDTFVAVLLTWVVLVVLFFSLSSGKRGVYVLPAVPALVMAAASWLPEVLRLPRTRRLAFILAAILAAAQCWAPCTSRSTARPRRGSFVTTACRHCCRSPWRAAAASLRWRCSASRTAGWLTAARSRPSSRPSASSCIRTWTTCARAGASWRRSSRRPPASRNSVSSARRNSTCCNCGDRVSISDTLAGGKRKSRRPTPQRGMRRNPAALCSCTRRRSRSVSRGCRHRNSVVRIDSTGSS